MQESQVSAYSTYQNSLLKAPEAYVNMPSFWGVFAPQAPRELTALAQRPLVNPHATCNVADCEPQAIGRIQAACTYILLYRLGSSICINTCHDIMLYVLIYLGIHYTVLSLHVDIICLSSRWFHGLVLGSTWRSPSTLCLS